MAVAENTSLDAYTSIQQVMEGMFHSDLSMEHRKRIASYRLFWEFYLRKHWSFERDPGDPTITLNYCRRCLDILNDFTFKNGFSTVIPDDPSTESNEREDREFVRLMLEQTWDKNSKPLWILEAGQQGGVTGDLYARISWEDNDLLEDPYARVDIIPSHLVLPEFGGPSGTDRKRLKRVLILTPSYEEITVKRKSSLREVFAGKGKKTISKEYEVVIYTEEWTNPVFDREGNLITPAMFKEYRNNDIITAEKENPLGEIPIVHIPNYPLSGEFYGISDLVDAIDLNRELNEKVTDISDIINYHSSPVTVISGAKIKDLEKGPNRVWGLPEGARADNLQLTGDLKASVDHYKNIKESIMELMGVPEAALGKTQHISNTSGVALAIQYMPMMEKRNIKILTYSLGLRLINRLIMKTTAIGDRSFGQKFDVLKGNKYRNEVIFPDPMPLDESIELERARARLDLGLSNKRAELEKQGHSQAEIDQIIQQRYEELQEESEMLFNSPTDVNGDRMVSRKGENQNMRGGDPSVRAQKVSNTAKEKIFSGDDGEDANE